MNIEEAIDILKNSIADYVIGEYCEKCDDNKICDDRNEDCYYQQAIDTVITAYEKEKEKNKELVEQNKDMKSLFNIQASIAKELDFNTNEKMVKFKDEYYVPDTMVINANIGEPKTVELRYISATKYLTKFD